VARFYLIDHSLIGLGGHHYEYALHVLQAAERFGYEIVLGCHRRFRERRRLPGGWYVLPVFPHHMYGANPLSSPRCGEPLVEGLRPSPRLGLSLWKRCAEAWRSRMERRRTEGFARAFRRIFTALPPRPGDIVFMPTLSDFDHQSLAKFLQSDPLTQQPDWHLQFHFAFLEGRPPEYALQLDRVDAMRARFESAVRATPDHRLHFYSTTDEMVDQFRRVYPAGFQLLPYPVNPVHRGRDPDQRPEGPLRITCAGGVREEKGQQQVVAVLRELWDAYFVRHKLQLLVQSKKSRFRAALHREGLPATSIGRWPLPCRSPIVDVPHPLSTDAYSQLLAASDLALFLYDSRRYYARCAGILVEMLAAGVPVVVPAGCWLGEQIAEPVYAHLDRLQTTLPQVGRIDADEVGWNRVDRRKPVANGASMLPTLSAKVVIPARATELMVRLRWAGPLQTGTFARLDVRQLSSEGKVLDTAATSFGQRKSDQTVPGLIHLVAGAARAEVTISNAFGDEPLRLDNVEFVFLAAPQSCQPACASGAVGLIAADTAQVPRLVREIVAHHGHYVRTARQFSQSWADEHDPAEIVRQLRRYSRPPAHRPAEEADAVTHSTRAA
jgi:glycosyltransferase involved in cell wall biosynthesis